MSTLKQEDSIDRQRSQVLPYCESRGFQIIREYVDEGISGSEIARRHSFQKMLRDAQLGAFQAIICDDKDRFGRFDVIDLGEVVAPLRRKGVWLETVAQGRVDWDTFAGRITDAVLQEAKNMELVANSRRVLSGQLLKAQSGMPTGGRALYGYRWETATDGRRRLVPDGRAAEVVRLVFRLYDEGWSLLMISQELQRRAVLSPRGLPRWSQTIIQRLLRNRRYVGDWTWGVHPQGKRHRFTEGQLRAVSRHDRPAGRNKADAWLVIPDSHEPLIDRDQFERVQARLSRNKAVTTPRPGGGSFVLIRLIVCGRCGSILSGITRPDGKRQYVCRGYLTYGKAYCFRHAIAEATLLAFLIRSLQNAYLDADNIARLRAEVAAQQAQDRSDDNIKSLKRRAAELERRIAQGNERLIILPADRIPGVVEQLRGWEAERDDARAELRRIETGEAAGSLERAVADAEAVLWRLQDAVRDDDAPLIREVVREMVNRIELHWDREDRGAKTYCRLARGVVWLRTPEAMSKLSPSASQSLQEIHFTAADLLT
jgi:DNA invertase Pin-like site-specific DNA recombinase